MRLDVDNQTYLYIIFAKVNDLSTLKHGETEPDRETDRLYTVTVRFLKRLYACISLIYRDLY